MQMLKLLLVGIFLTSISAYAGEENEPGGGGTGEKPAISCWITKHFDNDMFKISIDYCEYANGKSVSDFVLSEIRKGNIPYEKLE